MSDNGASVDLLVVQHYDVILPLSRGRYINWGSTTYEWVPAHLEGRRRSHPLPIRKAASGSTAVPKPPR